MVMHVFGRCSAILFQVENGLDKAYEGNDEVLPKGSRQLRVQVFPQRQRGRLLLFTFQDRAAKKRKGFRKRGPDLKPLECIP